MSPRPDASMDLLHQLTRDALEPEYRAVSAAGRGRRRGPGLAVGLGLAAALLAVAAVQATSARPDDEAERSRLVAEVQRAEQNQDELREQLSALDAEVRGLQIAHGGQTTPGAEDERLGVLAGTRAVTGPGVVVVISDSAEAARADGTDGEVTDEDLRQLVNGLWQAGAEAVSVNGRRLTTRTAIRMAGGAITVDYRSLHSPYRVEAIGDPRNLPAAFAATTGGAWCEYLRANFQIGYTISSSEQLSLPADPGLGVTKAKVGS